ncbi:MAG: serine--tRNA ligase [Bacteroidota bacterium]|jgi:seryl-tRNA synthetase|nr:serine--tRNA ligase [Bacteroidota bacterium]
MLQISLFKDHKQNIINGLRKKRVTNPDQIVEIIIKKDQERRDTQAKMDTILAESNNIARQIGLLFKEGKKAEAENLKTKTSELKFQSKDLGDLLEKLENEVTFLLNQVPNVPHQSVPEGKSSEDNIIIQQQGNFPDLPADALPHWDLIKKYDLIDFDLGNKITGAGFPVYKGKGARLQRALINFFLDEAIKAGYVEVQPPIIVNEDSAYATGQLPDKEGQMYVINNENFYLIPTAEVPITNMYRDVILTEEELPIKHVGYTPCFRREAGSWGAHVRGLNRLHQFDKVEIVEIQSPESSYKALERMCRHVQDLLEKLNLPYRQLLLCGGDMGFTSAITYDMEVYSAAQQKWLEVSSISNFETYQTNRLKLRFKNKDKKTQLLHSLNGSALALPRIMASLLENNQTPEGINIPEALWLYTGFKIIS